MKALDSVAAAIDIPAVIPVTRAVNANAKSQEALMAEGLGFLSRGDAAAAAAAFRGVLAINPSHYGAHYQLAVALDRAGRRREARPFWEKVLRMAEGYNDPTTIQAAQSRLRQTP
jgi:Flp pilus assembly protein TadD